MRKWQYFMAATAMTAVVIVPTVAAEASTYTVQKGDTLFKIATKHETTINVLKELNKLSSDAIYVNQQLKVPVTAKVESNKQNQVTTTTTTISTYTVVKGDTLTKIATKTKTTVAKIKEWNQLTSDAIYVGQALMIGKQASVTENHTVKDKEAVLSKADQEIAVQLKKEQVNSKKLSATATNKYTKLLAAANSLTGTPYVYGGTTAKGIDCSGFIYFAYNKAGYTISRKSSLDYFMNDTTKVTNPVPGDLVFFKNTYIETISHMGIYIGNNQFIHAGSNGVEVSNLSYSYWDSRFVAFKRFNIVK